MMTKNIFLHLPTANRQEEFFEQLAGSGDVRIERIASLGHTSPEDFWYDQEHDEWVLVLQGQARLLFEEGHEIVDLAPGDWLNIPAHARHRVAWTDPGERTIWLAVHYR
jgi:cupin 2 domain-containing protein